MASPLDNHTRMVNALSQIQNKKPVPEIDFTIHKLEDGNTISTQERVIKEVCARIYLRRLMQFLHSSCPSPISSQSDILVRTAPLLGPITRNAPPYTRTILV